MRVHVLLPLLACCSLRHDDTTIDIQLDYDHDQLTLANEVPYQPTGSFALTAKVTILDPNIDVSSKSPLRATFTIDEDQVIAGSTTTATTSLLPVAGQAGTLTGIAALAWPPGGPVHVHVNVAGVQESKTVPLALPELAFGIGTGSQNGSTATVPICLESSTPGGTVSVHLERATFVGGTSTDQAITLTSGGCVPTPVMELPGSIDIHSHAPFAISTSSDNFLASAVLPGASNAPPIAAIALSSITPPPVVPAPITLAFVQPIASTFPFGSVVSIDVLAITTNGPAKNVAITFQTSPPDVGVVPQTIVTNSGGHALASFAMPDLGGGTLVIGAIGGSTATPISLRN